MAPMTEILGEIRLKQHREDLTDSVIVFLKYQLPSTLSQPKLLDISV